MIRQFLKKLFESADGPVRRGNTISFPTSRPSANAPSPMPAPSDRGPKMLPQEIHIYHHEVKS